MSQQQPGPHPPTLPKAVSFFDGQNLYRSAKRVYGYIYPNYDPQKLAQQICGNQGWQLVETRFYTGFSNHREDPFWNHFWRAKFAQMKRDGVFVIFKKFAISGRADYPSSWTNTHGTNKKRKGS
jgi:hypothetical protein